MLDAVVTKYKKNRWFLCKAGAFIFMHHFSPWHSLSKLSSAHLAYRNGSYSCTISRHGIA